MCMWFLFCAERKPKSSHGVVGMEMCYCVNTFPPQMVRKYWSQQMIKVDCTANPNPSQSTHHFTHQALQAVWRLGLDSINPQTAQMETRGPKVTQY